MENIDVAETRNVKIEVDEIDDNVYFESLIEIVNHENVLDVQPTENIVKKELTHSCQNCQMSFATPTKLRIHMTESHINVERTNIEENTDR